LHGHGVARLAEGHWTHLDASIGLADDFVNALAAGGDGSAWVGTAKGLTHLDAAGAALQTYTSADGLPDDRVLALAMDAEGRLWAGTAAGAAVFDGNTWAVFHGPGAASPAPGAGLAHGYVSAVAVSRDGTWFGSVSAGAARYGAGTVASTRRLPVVLVHGWHGPSSDRLEDSEFRFLASWLRDDGYPVYYATGVLPKNTLHANAANIAAAIARAKQETGAAQVDIIAFSMGGLNTRTYIESALYAGDVDQAFILGTPQAGVRTWYPFLLREVHEWSRDPSAIELTPEYATLFNRLHQNEALVPYTLIAGDARGSELPETLRGLPPGDALISAGSALALDGPSVHKVLTDDLHAWSEQTIVLGLPSYLWPRRTYDAHIRNRLRLGAGAQPPGVPPQEATPPPVPAIPGHSPFYSGEVAPGKTVTQTVTVDTAGEVRFYLRGETGPLTFSLTDPQGRTVDAASIGDAGEFFDLGLADFQGYLIRQAQPGVWRVAVSRPGDAGGAARFSGYAVFPGSSLSLSASAGQVWFGEGETVAITATLQSGAGALPGARVEAEIGRPDMQVDPLTLFDDGEHGDGAAHDGVYGASYRPPSGGGYFTLFVTAQGTLGGAAFARTAETLFAVSPATAALTGTYTEASDDADRDGRYDALTLQVGVDVRARGNFLIAAALADAQGREVARAVAPVALNAGTQMATLRFPGYLLAGAQVDGPYTVSRVTLLDESGAAIPLQEAEDVLQTRPYRYQDFEGR
ncbi:MAG TPA: two-component regulator propeller domain-containing protein, partial [Anaerolineae bacterium]|nr:two-component regulator propeller domain-containing protein [Anaerolineae bacterium]